MNRHCFTWIALLTGLFFLGASAPKERPHGPVIRQVDHILVESSDPKPLFHFFTDVLKLPVAWPFAENRGFESGGVGAGDVNLEVLRQATRAKRPQRKTGEAFFSGLAFEPYPLSEALHELEIRGIPYSPPEVYTSTLPKGSQGPLWTTVLLPSFSRPGMSIFLYEYSPEFMKVAVRREQIGNRLVLNKGGPIGFKSIREIIIAASNYGRDAAEWGKMLGPRTAGGVYRAVSGPAIRLVRGSEGRIREIVFEVYSLDRAKAFLQKNDLLGSASSKTVFINPSKIQGLKIRLEE